MKSDASVELHVEANGVATLLLNRPQQHNAFNASMISAILKILNDLSNQSNIKMLIIKAIGESFSAGADLNWMRETANYTPEQNQQDARQLGLMLYNLAFFNKPTIAVVQGPAYGGGIGLIACCDIALVSTNASFRFSEVKLGLIPATIGPYVLRAIGSRQALAYFLSGKTFDAKTACRIGLCHALSSAETLEDTLMQWIKALLQSGPEALKAARQFVNDFSPAFTPDIIEQTSELIASLRTSAEGQEGLSAFLEKRTPNWIK